MEKWQEIALTAFVAAIASTMGAFITVRLALGRFRSERWWERKAEAYSRIVDCVYQVHAYSSRVNSRLERGILDSLDDASEAAGSAAIDELNRSTSIGAFIVSEDVARILEDFHSKLKSVPDENIGGYFDTMAAESADVLKKLRVAAKRDLGV